MDTTTQADLLQVHKDLFTDLTKLGQLIDPCNDRALATLHQAIQHLRDVEVLTKKDIGPPPRDDLQKAIQLKRPHLNLSRINPVLQRDVDDTILHVSCVLRALGEVDYEPDMFVEEGDFRLGIKNILSTCESALTMHRKYGNKLPSYATLTDECPEEDQS